MLEVKYPLYHPQGVEPPPSNMGDKFAWPERIHRPSIMTFDVIYKKSAATVEKYATILTRFKCV